MQACLTELYGLDLEYHVNDFLITDRRLAGQLGASGEGVDEELLIVQESDAASVALFLEQELVDRLERDNPLSSLNERNLADFLIALEGVSHFTYFAFKASLDRCVTLLELELQAEVDKFIAAATLLHSQGERVPAGLHHWLFSLPRLRDGLDAAAIERYEYANHFAARYCGKLWPHMRSKKGSQSVRDELRRFYRLPRELKIGHIEARSGQARQPI
jgi:hypothetical protein